MDQRILAAVVTVLSESGYEGASFEEVARRSGASKSSLYRRWKSKREMVIAALKAGPARRRGADEIDTGTLRGDLLALCRRLDHTMRSADGRTAMLLLQAGIEDPELCGAIETSVGPTGARLPRAVVDAVARGELPPDADPFPYEEIVGSALLIRRLNGLLVDDHYLNALVDTVLVPSLLATKDRRQPLPARIFSGNHLEGQVLGEFTEVAGGVAAPGHGNGAGDDRLGIQRNSCCVVILVDTVLARTPLPVSTGWTAAPNP